MFLLKVYQFIFENSRWRPFFSRYTYYCACKIGFKSQNWTHLGDLNDLVIFYHVLLLSSEFRIPIWHPLFKMAAVLQVKFGFCPISWPSWMILVSFWMFKDRWHHFSRLWSQLKTQDMLNVYRQMCTCLQKSWNRFETSLKGFAIYVQEQRNEDGWHGHGDVRVYLFILIVKYKYVLSITDIL